MRHAANDQDRFSVTNSLSVEFADFVGGDGDDTLDGTEADDALNGGAGNDVLNGNGGHDRLTGGSGTDSLRGGAGDDDVADYSIEGGAFGVVVNLALDGDGVSHTVPSGPNAGEIVSPGQAIDSFGNRDTIAAIENVLTGNLSDVVYGNGGSNRLESGGGNDFVYGLAGNDELIGGAGDDQLDGGIGDDVMVGGAGSDSYYVTSIGDVVTEAAGEGSRDLIFVTTSAVANYSLAGLPDIEQLIGVGLIDNVLTGNAADNVIDGGPGADAMAGGAGSDTYFVDNAGDTATEAAGEGIADEVRTSFATFTLGTDIERLTFIGTGASNLRGNAGNNVVTGANGDDFIFLQDGGDDIAVGGAGNDAFLFGAALTGADRVEGGAGARDQLVLQGNYGSLVLGAASLSGIEQIGFLAGDNIRFGAPGTESYSYNLVTNDGNVGARQEVVIQFNTLRIGENVNFNGSAETDGYFWTFAGRGIDVLVGSQQSDRFFFGADNRFGAGDKIDGQGGTDDQFALQGDYSGANAAVFASDTMVGIEKLGFLSAGDSRFGNGSADGFDYEITMHDGNVAAGQRLVVQANQLKSNGILDETLTFDGRAELDGSFLLFGGEGADLIFGGANADTLFGRGGADRIVGGGGGDALDGQSGADVFAYLALTDSNATGRDAITGFATGDRIDLSSLDAIAGGGDDAFSFIGSDAFTAAGQVRVVANGSGGWLVEADVDGDRLANLSILLVSPDPAYTPAANDFML